jgi:hexosaminidase
VTRFPFITVEDAPQFGIRGLMVDAAREYLPLNALKGYVVLCRVYKLNHLHIHLTDDGSFTFPSTKYPELVSHFITQLP